MLESVRNIFAIPDLRKRVLFTFALLAVYRIGCHIPTPGVDPKALIEFMNAVQNTFLGFVNTFTGGSLERVAVFALGIMPYITASIVLQLMTVVVPYLEKLSKEGELGRRKITQYTRYGTVLVSVIQSMGIAFFLEKTSTPGGAPLVPAPGWGFRLLTVLTLTTGCNLGCSYCYREDLTSPKNSSVMDYQTGVRSIDLLMQEASENERVAIVFFGGEPLTRIAVIRDLVAYAEEKAAAAGKAVDFSLTTNATLLTDEIIDFLDAHRFGITVSIDGDQAQHDRHRHRELDGPGHRRIAPEYKHDREQQPEHHPHPEVQHQPPAVFEDGMH